MTRMPPPSSALAMLILKNWAQLGLVSRLGAGKVRDRQVGKLEAIGRFSACPLMGRDPCAVRWARENHCRECARRHLTTAGEPGFSGPQRTGNDNDTCKQRENRSKRCETEKTGHNELHAPAPPCLSFSMWAASQAKCSVIPASGTRRKPTVDDFGAA